MFKPYVMLAAHRPDPIIHLANSETTTYCQFENTTHRKLEGHFHKPEGRLCINCLTVQNGGKSPVDKNPPVRSRQKPLFEFDTRKLTPRPDIDRTNPTPPWE
jgi:hypothetical protein